MGKRISINPISLAKATEADLDFIWSLYQQQIHGSWSRADLLRELKDPNYQVFIVNDTALAGFIILHDMFPEIEILNMAMDGSRQSQGLGSRVLSELSQRLKGQGYTKCFLEVRSQSQARKFYMENGFREQHIRRRYYTEPVDDAVVMVKGWE